MSASISTSNRGILVQYDFCTGCHACEVACKKEQDLGKGDFGIKVMEYGPAKKPDGRWDYFSCPFPPTCAICAKSAWTRQAARLRAQLPGQGHGIRRRGGSCQADGLHQEVRPVPPRREGLAGGGAGRSGMPGDSPPPRPLPCGRGGCSCREAGRNRVLVAASDAILASYLSSKGKHPQNGGPCGRTKRVRLGLHAGDGSESPLGHHEHADRLSFPERDMVPADADAEGLQLVRRRVARERIMRRTCQHRRRPPFVRVRRERGRGAPGGKARCLRLGAGGQRTDAPPPRRHRPIPRPAHGGASARPVLVLRLPAPVRTSRNCSSGRTSLTASWLRHGTLERHARLVRTMVIRNFIFMSDSNFNVIARTTAIDPPDDLHRHIIETGCLTPQMIEEKRFSAFPKKHTTIKPPSSHHAVCAPVAGRCHLNHTYFGSLSMSCHATPLTEGLKDLFGILVRHIMPLCEHAVAHPGEAERAPLFLLRRRCSSTQRVTVRVPAFADGAGRAGRRHGIQAHRAWTWTGRPSPRRAAARDTGGHATSTSGNVSLLRLSATRRWRCATRRRATTSFRAPQHPIKDLREHI